jgi:hypothetical protein
MRSAPVLSEQAKQDIEQKPLGLERLAHLCPQPAVRRAKPRPSAAVSLAADRL